MQILFVLMGDFFFFAYETNVAQHLRGEGVKRGSLGVWEGRGRGSGQEKAARGRGERFIVTTEEAGLGSASLSSFVIFLNSLHLRALRHSHYYSSLAFTVKHTLLSYQNVTLHEFIDCIDEFSLIRLFYRVWICLGVCMRPVMR